MREELELLKNVRLIVENFSKQEALKRIDTMIEALDGAVFSTLFCLGVPYHREAGKE